MPMMHGRGTMFLEIDVDGLLIHAASSTLADLVGAPTSQAHMEFETC